MPRKPSDKGSSPLETASLLALLLIPITPMTSLFQTAFDAIAAESIARHALRYSILWSEDQRIESRLEEAVTQLAKSWGREAIHSFSCGTCTKGSIVTLRIEVGSAQAVQVAGLEPR